ncbi:MAG TPA: hypothetical protein DEQ47_18735 [Solibacterales bacterium]|nr:hypothetical protein [Bryobacterales bacterium]
MTEKWLFVRSARQLITLRGSTGPRRGPALRELGLVADGALLIRDDLIVDVGPTRRIENLAAARRAINIDASGRVVMPALIDSEVQLLSPTGPAQEAAEDAVPLPSEHFYENWSAVARNISSKSSQRISAQARVLLERMARHGTGQVEVLSGIAMDASGSLKALRIHASVDRQPITVRSTFVATPGKSRQHMLEQVSKDILPAVSRKKLARFVAVIAGPGDVNNPHLRRILDASRATGLGIKVLCDALDPRDGVRLGLEARATSVSRLNRLGPAQIRQVALASTMALLTCPQPDMSTSERPEVARALVEEGAAIALATGFRPSASGTYSMQHALYLAVTAMRLHPAEALSAATINAAYNQGAGAEAGSLEPGKRADFILLNVSDYRELFARPGVNAVHLMVKAGKVVSREADVSW